MTIINTPDEDYFISKNCFQEQKKSCAVLLRLLLKKKKMQRQIKINKVSVMKTLF